MLREYTPDDRGEAIRLYMDCFLNEPFNYDWLDGDRIKRYFTDMERTPGFKGYVLEHGGAIAGICMGRVQDYFACCAYEINELIVARGHRGGGMGTALLNAMEEVLAGLGVRLISLSTDRNLPAYEFYHKNGYASVDDTVFMGKLL